SCLTGFRVLHRYWIKLMSNAHTVPRPLFRVSGLACPVPRLHLPPAAAYNSQTQWRQAAAKGPAMAIPTTGDVLGTGTTPALLGQPGEYVSSRGPIRGELLGPDRLRIRAAEIARASAGINVRPARSDNLLSHIERESGILHEAHRH